MGSALSLCLAAGAPHGDMVLRGPCMALDCSTPTAPDWSGWTDTGVGGGSMARHMRARHRFLWWPLHATGHPIGAVWLMDALWFSILLCRLIELVVMKCGCPRLFRLTRPFFLGLIMGRFLIAGLWPIADYCSGMTDNVEFWI